MRGLGTFLIGAGLVLVVLGVVFTMGGGPLSWLGRLPGDIVVERPGMRFYFPLATSVVLSIVVSVLAIVFRWLR